MLLCFSVVTKRSVERDLLVPAALAVLGKTFRKSALTMRSGCRIID